MADHFPSENAQVGSGQQALEEGKIHAYYPNDAISRMATIVTCRFTQSGKEPFSTCC
ncbi:hypothetical protein [Mycetohabitans sp. B8]|uniref:hypothetical protein n=1 Tax=Mycetohabitans sp. B8 TaxID=2841845 RepID=UPI001F1BE0E4|nr:hypothetical protein [Mycetohabitans sp. B8]